MFLSTRLPYSHFLSTPTVSQLPIVLAVTIKKLLPISLVPFPLSLPLLPLLIALPLPTLAFLFPLALAFQKQKQKQVAR